MAALESLTPISYQLVRKYHAMIGRTRPVFPRRGCGPRLDWATDLFIALSAPREYSTTARRCSSIWLVTRIGPFEVGPGAAMALRMWCSQSQPGDDRSFLIQQALLRAMQ